MDVKSSSPGGAPWVDVKQDLPSTAPEVVPCSDKERAFEDGKQVAPGDGPEVFLGDTAPQAIDEEGGKEVVSSVSSLSAHDKELQLPPRSRKIRGSGCLLIIATLIVAVALAIALGVGLGVSLRHQKTVLAPPSKTSTSLNDTTPIATPTGTPLPFGTYALSLGAARETQAACLPQQSQEAAWGCTEGQDAHLAVAIEQFVSSSKARILSTANDTVVRYGSQTSSIKTTATNLLPVLDTQDEEYGPAYYFQSTYDKVVVVPEDGLTNDTQSKRRHVHGLEKRQTLSPGDKPWFCIFNQTVLEGFIYINKSVTSTGTTPALVTVTPTSQPASSLSPTTTRESTASASTASTPALFEPLPFLFKLRERQTTDNPSSPKPYCQQYQILSDGEANWLSDDQGDPVIIHLDESDPEGKKRSALIADRLAERDVSDGCLCEWLSGAS